MLLPLPARFVRLTFGLLTLGAGAAMASAAPTYLDRVVRFADTMLEYGTDRYGSQQSPLFANALTRDRRPELVVASPKLKQWPPRFTELPNVFIDGDYAHKVTIVGSDVGADRRLYTLLYDLSKVTGRPKYARAADVSLKWFLDNTPNPVTGLLPWGEHSGWDFRKETFETGPDVWPDPVYQNKHEFQSHWDLWDKFATLPTQGTAVLEKYAAGLYTCHVYFDGDRLRYSRHGDLLNASNKMARGDKGMFPRHGGYFVDAMSAAWFYTSDRAFKKDMAEKIGRFATEWERQLDEYGYIPFDLSKKDMGRAPNSSLAESLRRAAPRLAQGEPALSARLTALADRIDPPHPAYTTVGKLMTGGIPDRDLGKILKQKNDPGFNIGWNLPGKVPLQYADAILALVDAANSWDAKAPYSRQQYLDRAKALADEAIDLFLEDGTGSPLPRMLDKNSPVVLVDGKTPAAAFYHSYTGGDDLIYALLRLDVALKTR